MGIRETWLPQVLECAASTRDEELLSSWVDADRPTTSGLYYDPRLSLRYGLSTRSPAADFDELLDRLFDELEADAMLSGAEVELAGDVEGLGLLRAFLRAMRDVDAARATRAELRKARLLIKSQEWTELQSSAHALLSHASRLGYDRVQEEASPTAMPPKATQLTQGLSRRLMYVENKSGEIDGVDARIGYVTFSKTGKTVYYRGRTLLKKRGISANFVDTETGEAYWISGVKKRGSNVHWAESASVIVDDDAMAEYRSMRA